MKMIVLGCGLVGGPMAIDLAKEENFEITIVDKNRETLDALASEHTNITTVQRDLGDPQEVSALVADYDLVINAVPGFMGFQTLQAIIEAGKNVVDIAFYSENPFDLDALAKEKGVTAIVDCGVARYVENGNLVIRPALSDPELIDFPGIGTLEAFNTDGLRTLADTIDAPNMKEKTLRYHGHIEKMAVLRAAGFFDEEAIEIDGHSIRPVDFTAKLLFPQWQMEEGEVDITVLQIIIEGEKNGTPRRFVYNLLDKFDAPSKTHSMARTTGYTATVAARMLAKGL
ncbi:MAG: saccharopine dehydrogenase NADP-binding domain-containing protein [Acidobacteria bacterium]|nr:saccharopine dehydrogenase NADP-binding domain-containing protein [Candidatus Sulfomarinibacter kjeldsenii]